MTYIKVLMLVEMCLDRNVRINMGKESKEKTGNTMNIEMQYDEITFLGSILGASQPEWVSA